MTTTTMMAVSDVKPPPPPPVAASAVAPGRSVPSPVGSPLGSPVGSPVAPPVGPAVVPSSENQDNYTGTSSFLCEPRYKCGVQCLSIASVVQLKSGTK